MVARIPISIAARTRRASNAAISSSPKGPAPSRVTQVAQRDGGRRVRQDDAGIAKADERDEEAHARRHGRVEFERDGGDNQLAHAERGQQQKRDAGKEDRAQRRLPRHAHPFHHRVGEIGVEPHPRRQRDRVPRQRAHQHAAHRRRQDRWPRSPPPAAFRLHAESPD